jgi:hypothetical protein
MLQARLVVEVVARDAGFAPARPPRQITVHDITQALRIGQGTVPATREDLLRDPVRREFERMRQAEQAVASTSLEELAGRAASAAPPPPPL